MALSAELPRLEQIAAAREPEPERTAELYGMRSHCLPMRLRIATQLADSPRPDPHPLDFGCASGPSLGAPPSPARWRRARRSVSRALESLPRQRGLHFWSRSNPRRRRAPGELYGGIVLSGAVAAGSTAEREQDVSSVHARPPRAGLDRCFPGLIESVLPAANASEPSRRTRRGQGRSARRR
jgi:hypothetical protein